jgi:hypothetical protein
VVPVYVIFASKFLRSFGGTTTTVTIETIMELKENVVLIATSSWNMQDFDNVEQSYVCMRSQNRFL